MHENLNCAATNCVYNSSQLCYAGNIKVDGRQAMSTVLLLKIEKNQE